VEAVTTALLVALAAVLGVAATLTAEAAYRRRARILAAYRALAALRGCKHARTLSRPHLSLVAHGTHRAPKRTHGRHEVAETREAAAA
jgi:hypothetical protein